MQYKIIINFGNFGNVLKMHCNIGYNMVEIYHVDHW